MFLSCVCTPMSGGAAYRLFRCRLGRPRSRSQPAICDHSNTAEYMAATGFTFHPTIAFRSGLGPYKRQGISVVEGRAQEQRSSRAAVVEGLEPGSPASVGASAIITQVADLTLRSVSGRNRVF